MVWTPHLCRVPREGGGIRYSLGHELVDAFLEFVGGRSRPNTVRAYAHDLKVFFSVVAKDPVEVTPADVMAFVSSQHGPRPGAEKVRESRRRARVRGLGGGGLPCGWRVGLGRYPPAVLPAQGDEPSRAIHDRTRGEPAAVIGVHEPALRGEHAAVRGQRPAQVYRYLRADRPQAWRALKQERAAEHVVDKHAKHAGWRPAGGRVQPRADRHGTGDGTVGHGKRAELEGSLGAAVQEGPDLPVAGALRRRASFHPARHD